MTNARFWLLVGRELADARETLGLTWADVERAGGPAAPTIRDNERGKARTIITLNKHTEALGIGLLDVFATVIERNAGRPTATPALAELIRRYEQTSPKGKLALRAVGQLCPPEPAQATRPVRKEKRRGNGATGRAHVA